MFRCVYAGGGLQPPQVVRVFVFVPAHDFIMCFTQLLDTTLKTSHHHPHHIRLRWAHILCSNDEAV